MRNLLNGCLNLLIGTFHMMLIAVVLSAVYTGAKWLLSLAGVCESPTWGDFLYGGLAVFVLIFLFTLVKVSRMERRFKDDPEYKYNYDRWRQTHGDHF